MVTYRWFKISSVIVIAYKVRQACSEVIMGKNRMPSTGALRMLRAASVGFEIHRYKYEARGGTQLSSRELQVGHHQVIKTLVMQDHQSKPMIVLMHGDKEVSTRALARHLGVKNVSVSNPERAQKHSGYLVGGTSPFATRRSMPVYVEESIFKLPLIYINGGQRGLLVSIEPAVLEMLLKVQRVSVAQALSLD